MAVNYKTNTGITADQDAVFQFGGASLRLMGYAAREAATSADVASFDIVDGDTGDGGTLMVPVELAASSSDSEWFGPDGIRVASGALSLNVVSGEVDVVVFYKVE